MTEEDFEQLKATVKQWLFHTSSLDPTNYANDLKVKFIEPREKRIEELEKEKCELLGIIQGKDKAIFVLKKENAELKEQIAELQGKQND